MNITVYPTYLYTSGVWLSLSHIDLVPTVINFVRKPIHRRSWILGANYTEGVNLHGRCERFTATFESHLISQQSWSWNFGSTVGTLNSFFSLFVLKDYFFLGGFFPSFFLFFPSYSSFFCINFHQLNNNSFFKEIFDWRLFALGWKHGKELIIETICHRHQTYSSVNCGHLRQRET